ncbi:MAG: hypothetical protein ABSH44_23120 [Bryobacteraceae bacterium]
MKLSRRQEILLDCFLLFLFTAVLVGPYFKAKYTDKWSSIESTFISDARFLAAHWPHPQWQPLWYTGTRFDYIYPPALRYGTAVISKVTGFWPVKAYHFYTIFFYCVGIAGVYLLIRAGARSRGAAWLGAAATALISPSFLFLKEMRVDSGPLVPVRLGVLIKYGEGPHMTALALIPFALAFTWRALENRRPGSVALAAIFSAAVASNNFYGATALTMFYAIVLWSFWVTRRDFRMVLPAFAIPALAYGLTAFWLVPSYFRITVRNMRFVSEAPTAWSFWVALAVAGVFAFASNRLARSRPDRTWAVFVAGCVVFFSLDVLGHYYFNFRVAGEPGRLIPELDMVLILGVLAILEWLWRRPRRAAGVPAVVLVVHGTPFAITGAGRAPRVAAAIVVVAAFATTAGYVRISRKLLPLWPNYTARVEYRITDWLWRNMPGARVYASGSVRFWFDAWHDLAQLGGGSEQGLLNTVTQDAQWELMAGSSSPAAILWLQAFGVDVIYVPGPKSEEPYKDIQHPERFAGVTPLLFDDGQGNALYRIPRRYPARARVVESARLDARKMPRFPDDVEYLRGYVDVVENGPDSPVTFEREGTDAMLLRAKVGTGQAILVQETYDPAWQARSNGRRLPVRADIMGFMVVEAPPGEHQIRLAFVTPAENRVGWVLTGISLLFLAALAADGMPVRKH